MDAVLVVDVANVMGSRPDGWWRDRAGAAARLLASVAPLVGREVQGPDGDPLAITRVVAVVEGAARDVEAPGAAVEVARAPADGDATIADVALGLSREPPAEDGLPVVVVVVTADRGLRARLPPGVLAAGPRWLLHLLDAPPARG